MVAHTPLSYSPIVRGRAHLRMNKFSLTTSTHPTISRLQERKKKRAIKPLPHPVNLSKKLSPIPVCGVTPVTKDQSNDWRQRRTQSPPHTESTTARKAGGMKTLLNDPSWASLNFRDLCPFLPEVNPPKCTSHPRHSQCPYSPSYRERPTCPSKPARTLSHTRSRTTWLAALSSPTSPGERRQSPP